MDRSKRLWLTSLGALPIFLLMATGILGGEEKSGPAPQPKSEAKQEQPVCLLTGFDPFGPIKVNASWETAKALDGQTVAGYKIATARLPVVYDEMAAPLKDAIEKHKPAIVICMGVGTETVQIETLARNGYHPMKPPDNKKKPPPREKIVPEGKGAIATALPVDAIVKSLREAKIGVKTSDDAGGYLCNECFYRLMATELKGAAEGIKARGFIHVPDYRVRDPEGGSFTPEKLQKAVKLAIEATAESLKPKK